MWEKKVKERINCIIQIKPEDRYEKANIYTYTEQSLPNKPLRILTYVGSAPTAWSKEDLPFISDNNPRSSGFYLKFIYDN